MSSFVLSLVLASTFMHAGWNLIARSRRAEAETFWRMQMTVVVGGLVPATVGWLILHCLTGKALLCVAGSGTCCGVYYYCLARGYHSGDFTTVYPAARALPVLLVGVADVLRGLHPSAYGWLGMTLVSCGCLLVPLTSLRDIRLAHYLRPSVLWIVLTAAGTVGYSVLDKLGTEAIPRGPGQAAVYGYVFFVVAAAVYRLLLWLVPFGKALGSGGGWRLPVMAGTLNFGAYWLILWAFQLTDKASYVVAFRQFSIVIGVAVAFLIFHEPGRRVRLIGTVLITAGLVVLKLRG